MASIDEWAHARRVRLESFSEQGTEGVVWSVNDRGLPGYDTLHCLNDGDRLRVLRDNGNVEWEGVVKLDYRRSRVAVHNGHVQIVRGMWVRGVQAGVEPEAWVDMFAGEPRALILGRYGDPYASHPFEGSREDLVSRLAALDGKRAASLFQSALYPWLVFYGGGDWFSLGRSEWGLDMEEVLRLLGEPSDARITAWRSSKYGGDSLLPFSLALLERLADLHAIRRELDWAFPDVAARAAWLSAPGPRTDGLAPRELLLSGSPEGARLVRSALEPASD